MKFSTFLMMLLILVTSCGYKHQYRPKKIPKAETLSTLTEAYRYGFPIVLMDMIRESKTNTEMPIPKLESAPMNQVVHYENKNNAVMNSSAWIDLSKGPLILEVPTTNDYYYSIQLMSAWTNVYASPGKRTTGTLAKKFILAGPKWDGDLLPNTDFIRSPTNLGLMTVTVEKGTHDQQRLSQLQNGFKIYPIQFFNKNYEPPLGISNPNLDPRSPLEKVLALNSEEFFSKLNNLLINNPRAPEDDLAMDQFEQVYVSPGQQFKLTQFDPSLRKSIEDIPRQILDELKTAAASRVLENGWQNFRGSGDYGTDYKKRALFSYMNAFGSFDKDQLRFKTSTDFNGHQLESSKNYILHFEASEIPDVNGLWSISATNNSHHSYLSSLGKLSYNKDGSLDVYLQKTKPQQSSNWIRIPEGKFEVTANIYWPKEDVLDSNWKMPPIVPERNFRDKLSMIEKE